MATSAIIPEVNYLLCLVEKQYGNKLKTATDFEALSISIENDTSELISSSTLKRLFGYVSLKPVPRKSTLDILSRFIGDKDYDDYCRKLKDNPLFNSAFFSAKTVYASDLEEGAQVTIGWEPNRIVRLEHLGNGSFEVKESVNSSLMAGDRFETASFMLGYPLYLSRVLRDGIYTPSFIAGITGGLNRLEAL
ncbi:MAG: hypothetical protein ACI3ZC_05595 [Candidatus Cryptobacteroides sp.]